MHTPPLPHLPLPCLAAWCVFWDPSLGIPWEYSYPLPRLHGSHTDLHGGTYQLAYLPTCLFLTKLSYP